MSKGQDLHRQSSTGAAIEFSFEGRALEAREGESVSAALLAAGELVTTRSAKFRRARGPYCMRGDCGSCLVRIDGRPNQRSCLTRVREGMVVEAQNILRPDGLDPTRLIDQAFPGGMDHHHFMVKPRVLNQVMQGVARGLTGLGDLPDAKVKAADGHAHKSVDVLIVGSGASGRGAAEKCAEAGADYLVLDRLDRQALSTIASWPDAPLPPPEDQLEQVGIFAAYALEGWIVGASNHAPGLRTYRAQHILLANGGREAMLPVPNNDRPGVVAAAGLLHLLRDNQLEVPEGAVVLIGEGPHAEALADQLRARRVSPNDVVDIIAGDRVKAVKTKSGRIKCSFVALAPTPAPAHELASMLGVTLAFDGEGFAAQRDERGECGEFGRSRVWATGDLTGFVGPKAAHADGRRVATQILAQLQGGTNNG